MIEMAISKSVADASASIAQSATLAPPIPSVTPTGGTGFVSFDLVKKYLSDKPLRIRVYDDPEITKSVNRLAEAWINERQRGNDVHDMIESPAYEEIIKLGQRAIRPVLLMLKKKPDHWFFALQKITRDNPVPPESEGKMKEMADAWIKWGKERGYIRELD